jgi:HEAT repeat protein
MKARLRTLLKNGDTATVVTLATENRRVLSYLTALTYDLEPTIADQAVITLGQAAGVISDTDPEFVRGHLRRLFWLLNDESGSIGWRAAEAIGEIIRARPEHFTEFVPNLIALLDMEPEDAPRFRSGVLHAIARIAEVIDPSQL